MRLLHMIAVIAVVMGSANLRAEPEVAAPINPSPEVGAPITPSPEVVQALPRPDAICLALPLTGPHAALGLTVARQIEDVVASSGRKVVRIDTHPSVTAVPLAMARARESGCAAVLGGIGDREAVAMADAAVAAGIPLLSLGRIPDGHARGGVVWARTSREDIMGALARYLVLEQKVQQATVVYDSSGYGRSTAALFAKTFGEAGGTIVLQQEAGDAAAVAATAKTLAASRKALVNASTCVPEALVLAVEFQAARRLVPFIDFEGMLRSEGRCPGMILAGPSVWNDPLRVARAGDALSGAVFADVIVPDEMARSSPADMEICDAARLALTATGAAALPVPGGAIWEGIHWRGCSGDLAVVGGRVTGRTIGIFRIERGRIEPWTSSN